MSEVTFEESLEILKAIRAAIEEEREACAKIIESASIFTATAKDSSATDEAKAAEQFLNYGITRELAAQIRARGDE